MRASIAEQQSGGAELPPRSSLSELWDDIMNSTKIYFDHEKLVAYQRSIEFVAWAAQFLENRLQEAGGV